MGIGNTTTSSAVACALTGEKAEMMTGRGAGLSDAGLLRKKQVIDRGLALRCPDPSDPVDVLSQVGGLDLAGLTGVFLGCARYRIPAVRTVLSLLWQRWRRCGSSQRRKPSSLPPTGPENMPTEGFWKNWDSRQCWIWIWLLERDRGMRPVSAA